MITKSMKKRPFDEKELSLLRGNYAKVARKYGVTKEYVHYLASGKKKANNQKAKDIINDLTRLLAVFKQVL